MRIPDRDPEEGDLFRPPIWSLRAHFQHGIDPAASDHRRFDERQRRKV